MMSIKCLFFSFSIGYGINRIEKSTDYEYWYGEEWMDYDDQLEIGWKYEIWQLYLDNARISELSTLPGMTKTKAFEILSNRKDSTTTQFLTSSSEFYRKVTNRNKWNSFTDDFEFRAHVKVLPPKASESFETERFEGSALGMTQKYFVRSNQLSFGGSFDKDRYEPDFDDLTRYWAAWNGSTTNIILGDFHVTTGHGLGLWTQPTFFDSYDAPGSYRRSGRGIMPSTDYIENSALRGIGVSQKIGRFRVTLFTSETKLDAILDESLKHVISLSSSGLHRTPIEREKEDIIHEVCFGGSLSCALSPSQLKELVVEMSGYHSKYSLPFNPEPESHRRYSMTGRYFGAGSANFIFTSPQYTIFGEGALDRDSNLAWLFGFGNSSGSSGKFDADFLVQHYPVEFSNPRAISQSTSASQYGKTSSALLVRGVPSSGFLKNWRSHIEIELLPWRSFSIPVAHSRSKVSFETTFRSVIDSKIILRFRRKTFESGTGENGHILPVTDNRLRITNDFLLEKDYFRYVSLWVEGVRQRIEYPSKMYSESPNQFGWMTGFRFSVQIGETSRGLGSINYSGSVTGFNTDSGSVILYIGDGYLPDRINSAQLSGKGIRWASSIYWRWSSRNWLTFKAARTHKTGNNAKSNDLEMYISLSYLFRNHK
ncbi:MAG: hypothetical protein HN590_16240 [Calditrichaeota bacterium]|nr:hypothetical protein [Calditrichota bacterium]